MRINIITVSLLAVLLTSCGAGTGNTADTPAASESTSSETSAVTVPETAASSEEAAASVPTTVQTTVQTTVATTVLPFEDTPENAFERLTGSFMQPDGSEKAPDTYAGMYSYFGKLYVCITTEEPEPYYTDLLGEYTCITYKTVNHSFNELSDVAEKVYDLIKNDFDVSYYYVDVPSNKAGIVLKSGDTKAVGDFLKEHEPLDFDRSEIVITVEGEE